MLESSWEAHATRLANAEDLISEVKALIERLGLDISQPARVVYARDTRPSGAALVKALEDGLIAMCAETTNADITTTPILHYLVRAINTAKTEEPYGNATEEGYYNKLSSAFKRLLVCMRFLLSRSRHNMPLVGREN